MLVKLLPDIKKYEQMVLFFNPSTDYSPVGIRIAYERFLYDYGILGTIEENYVPGTLQRNTLYFIKNDSILWIFLKDCSQGNYVLGQDLGILSYDDNVLKEIIMGGITTLSTDFKEMAKTAAQYIKNGDEIKSIAPTHLIRRNSL